VIETCPFFFGLKPAEETIVYLADGKMLIIKLLFMTEPNEEGNREVSFELNGTARTVEVRDRSVKVTKTAHRKAKGTADIGAPLQGKLSKVLVKAGEAFKENQPLFVIEAMKMETIVSAPKAGKAKSVLLPEGEIVEQDDAIIEVE
jgi:pyruvate carboxylase